MQRFKAMKIRTWSTRIPNINVCCMSMGDFGFTSEAFKLEVTTV